MTLLTWDAITGWVSSSTVVLGALLTNQVVIGFVVTRPCSRSLVIFVKIGMDFWFCFFVTTGTILFPLSFWGFTCFLVHFEHVHLTLFNRGSHTSSENGNSLKNERKAEPVGALLHEESVTPY